MKIEEFLTIPDLDTPSERGKLRARVRERLMKLEADYHEDREGIPEGLCEARYHEDKGEYILDVGCEGYEDVIITLTLASNHVLFEVCSDLPLVGKAEYDTRCSEEEFFLQWCVDRTDAFCPEIRCRCNESYPCADISPTVFRAIEYYFKELLSAIYDSRFDEVWSAWGRCVMKELGRWLRSRSSRDAQLAKIYERYKPKYQAFQDTVCREIIEL